MSPQHLLHVGRVDVGELWRAVVLIVLDGLAMGQELSNAPLQAHYADDLISVEHFVADDLGLAGAQVTRDLILQINCV